MLTLALVVISYLLGNICFAYVVGRVGYRVDLRNHGSGNLGATNVARVLGPFAAVLVTLGDVAKGFVAVTLGRFLSPANPSVALACGLAVIAGHNWPVLLGFRGGRGIATSLGVLLAVMPLAAVVPAVVFVATIALTRYVSLGSVLAAFSFPITVYVMRRILAPPGYSGVYLAVSIVVAAFAVYRHQANIRRLLSGTEPKLGQTEKGGKKR